MRGPAGFDFSMGVIEGAEGRIGGKGLAITADSKYYHCVDVEPKIWGGIIIRITNLKLKKEDFIFFTNFKRLKKNKIFL